MISDYQKTLIKRIKKDNKISDSEVTHHLLSSYLIEDSKSLSSFRKRLKKRIGYGIDKPFLRELVNLYIYLEHLINIYDRNIK